MTWTYDEDSYKDYTRRTWNESAPAYHHWIDALEAYTPPLLEAAELEPGHRVLDIATGPGLPALTIADIVAPDGEALGIDLADAMIDVAQRRAKDAGLDNARFQVMDAEDLPLDDATFHRVVSRFGLQIITDPDAVLHEAHRVLQPDGIVAASVWADPGERSPALHAIVGPMLHHCTPDDTGYLPTPYELGGPHTLRTMLQDAGFTDVRTERHRHPLRFPDEEAYLDAMLEGTPLGPSLSEEDEEVQEAVVEETKWNLEKWGREVDGGIELEAEAVVGVGGKG